jgi:hypothetical protein
MARTPERPAKSPQAQQEQRAAGLFAPAPRRGRTCSVRLHGAFLQGLFSWAGASGHRSIWEAEGFVVDRSRSLLQDAVWALAPRKQCVDVPALAKLPVPPPICRSTTGYFNMSYIEGALFGARSTPRALSVCKQLVGRCAIAGEKCSFAFHQQRIVSTVGRTRASPAMADAYVWPQQSSMLLRAMRGKPHARWIFKACRSNLAKGIALVPSIVDLDLLRASAPSNQSMVQEFVERPLLLNGGRKFHIRLYVLVASWLPLRILVYKEGVVNFASEPYVVEHGRRSGGSPPSSMDRLITNSVGAVRKQKSDETSRLSWTLARLRTALGSAAMRRVWAEIRRGIAQILCNAASCRLEPSARQVRCFDLLGIDVLLTDTLRPVILEVNSGPMMDLTTSPTLIEVKSGLMHAIIRTAISPRMHGHCSLYRSRKLAAEHAADERRFQQLLRRFRDHLDRHGGRSSATELSDVHIAMLRRMNSIDARLRASSGGAGFDELPLDEATCPFWRPQADDKLYMLWRALAPSSMTAAESAIV